ncbi:hypothetical protein KM043_006527 [Ampulex compressa]|nr:hypothetical protein KM043_006527 [Ampulex compressa]
MINPEHGVKHVVHRYKGLESLSGLASGRDNSSVQFLPACIAIIRIRGISLRLSRTFKALPETPREIWMLLFFHIDMWN